MDELKLADVTARVQAAIAEPPPAKPNGKDDGGDGFTRKAEGEEAAPDPIESKARADGWVPKEEWSGDADKWRPAKEFNERGELYGTIKSLKHRLKETEDASRALADHNRKIAERLSKEAAERIHKDRDAAIEVGDVATVKKLDAKLGEVEKELATAKPAAPAIPPVVVEWVERNPWFKEDPAASQAAYQKFGLLEQQRPGNTEQNLKDVSAYIRKRFPDLEVDGSATQQQERAEQQQEAAPRRQSTVETPTRRVAGSKRAFSFNDLNDIQRQVCLKFERQQVMKRDEYIKQLVDSGELA